VCFRLDTNIVSDNAAYTQYVFALSIVSSVVWFGACLPLYFLFDC